MAPLGRTMTRALLVLIGAVALVLVLVYLLQRFLIYLPYGEVPRPAPAGAEEVEFTTEDGLTISGWFLASDVGEPRPAILVANGNAGNRAHRTPLGEALHAMGVNVLLFDYRGYGGNPGIPAEEGLRMDAAAARRYLESRSDVDPSRIVYFGESIGAAVMVALAAEQPPAGLVLRSPFTSLADVGRIHYPWLPVALLLRDHYETTSTIGRVEAPLVVIAGSRDNIVPIAQSRAVFEAAPGRKRFVEIRGAGHNDAELFTGEELLGEVRRFLEEVARADSET